MSDIYRHLNVLLNSVCSGIRATLVLLWSWVEWTVTVLTFTASTLTAPLTSCPTSPWVRLKCNASHTIFTHSDVSLKAWCFDRTINCLSAAFVFICYIEANLQTCPTHSRYIYMFYYYFGLPTSIAQVYFLYNNLLKQFSLTSKI